MAQRGEAQDYYNNDNRGYQMQPPQQEGQQNYPPPQGMPPQQNGGMPPPPSYNGNMNYSPDQKPDFNQAFKVEKPKWNDLWAGLLFLAVCAGFVAVSAISIQGYAATKGFNGGGIYGSNNTFGLDTNTLVLFVFCLASALVLGYGYVCLARGKYKTAFDMLATLC
jgi:hypothetical protein